MPTYTIVSSTKFPLDPGEINAGGTITVADGDIFIIDPTANGDVTFVDGGGATNFQVQFAASNGNTIQLTTGTGLEPTFDIATGVNAADVAIDASASDGLTLNAGDNVSLGKLTGSTAAADTISIGNGFTTTEQINLGNGDNVASFGDDASIASLSTGTGADDITFGDRASFVELDGGMGNDTIYLGDDIVGTRIKGGSGDDLIRVGARATLSEINGEGNTDTLFTQTTGLSLNNIENVNVVCFAAGTRILTDAGYLPVERLKLGAVVRTLDNGPVRLRWAGRFWAGPEQQAAAARLRPIRIARGALGPETPERDVYVSQQHRVLLQSAFAQHTWGAAEVLVPAKKLLAVDRVERVDTCAGTMFHHLLFERHEIIVAEGAAFESMYLGAQSISTLNDKQRTEITACWNGLPPEDIGHRPCRKFLNRQSDIDCLIARHQSHSSSFQALLATTGTH